MRNCVSSLFVLIVIVGCSQMPNVSIIDQKWTTSTEVINSNTFGYVKLEISGETDGDKVTIETYGDGLKAEQELKIVDGKFSENILIAFTPEATDTNFTQTTNLKVYKGVAMYSEELESGALSY